MMLGGGRKGEPKSTNPNDSQLKRLQDIERDLPASLDGF